MSVSESMETARNLARRTKERAGEIRKRARDLMDESGDHIRGLAYTSRAQLKGLADVSKSQIREAAAGMLKGLEKPEADPIVQNVAERYYPVWKKAWQGTVRQNTRRHSR